MPRTLSEIINALPEDERAKIEARARELIAEEKTVSLRPAQRARAEKSEAE